MTSSLPPTAIAYDDRGSGPPVVLLHPSGFGPALVEPFAGDLAGDRPAGREAGTRPAGREAGTFRVVVPHRRGFGGSAGLTPPMGIEDLCDDIVEVLDSLGLDRPTIVGVSAGATLALAFAVRHPGRVGAVVAHEPLIGPLGGTIHLRMVSRIGRLLDRSDEPRETSLFMAELVGRRTWNSLPAGLRENVERWRAATRREASIYGGFALDEDELAALAGAGVMATVGERSAPVRHELSAALAGRGVTTRVIPGAAHLPVLDARPALAALVDEVVAARLADRRVEGAGRRRLDAPRRDFHPPTPARRAG